MEHIIDAKGKAMGRVASEAAVYLMGKHSAGVRKNVVAVGKVRVVNAGKLEITEKKARQKVYHSHSGFPGGDRKLTLRHTIEKKGKSIALRTAVSGMLPKNTLRVRRLKNLIIEE